jgi:hypothetical protein
LIYFQKQGDALSLPDNLVRLSGTGCRFYAYGHCLYEEMLNPGFNRAFACTVLERLDAHFEGFAKRVEGFGLEEPQAAMIWDSYSRKMASREVCADFFPNPRETRGQCLFRYDNACILRCPVCAGRCVRYQSLSHHHDQGEFFRH